MPDLVDDSDDEDDNVNAQDIFLPDYPVLPVVVSPIAAEDPPNLNEETLSVSYTRPTRIRKASERLNLFASVPELERYSYFHITVRRAMREIKDTAEPAIMLELANITKMKVLKGRHLREHSPSQIKGVIPSQLNVTTNGDPASDGKGRTVLLKLVW